MATVNPRKPGRHFKLAESFIGVILDAVVFTFWWPMDLRDQGLPDPTASLRFASAVASLTEIGVCCPTTIKRIEERWR